MKGHLIVCPYLLFPMLRPFYEIYPELISSRVWDHVAAQCPQSVQLISG